MFTQAVGIGIGLLAIPTLLLGLFRSDQRMLLCGYLMAVCTWLIRRVLPLK